MNKRALKRKEYEIMHRLPGKRTGSVVHWLKLDCIWYDFQLRTPFPELCLKVPI